MSAMVSFLTVMAVSYSRNPDLALNNCIFLANCLSGSQPIATLPVSLVEYGDLLWQCTNQERHNIELENTVLRKIVSFGDLDTTVEEITSEFRFIFGLTDFNHMFFCDVFTLMSKLSFTQYPLCGFIHLARTGSQVMFYIFLKYNQCSLYSL